MEASIKQQMLLSTNKGMSVYVLKVSHICTFKMSRGALVYVLIATAENRGLNANFSLSVIVICMCASKVLITLEF